MKAGKNFSLILLLFWLISCSSEEEYLPRGSQLLLNPNLSLYPDNVFPWAPLIPNEIQYGVSREVFLTGNRSLFIENKERSTANSATWTQTYTGPMPAPGSTLELLAFVKGEDVIDLTAGGRVHIGIKVFPFENSESRNASATNEQLFQGDFDWFLLKATLENFPEDAEKIQVRLFVPDLTLGKVYFDEINLFVR
ncbi:hypothetical protein [Algoriphagus hitonicola]|uniref:Uncharacterized protein n=1 Tax=Algoriphagus hitonicola TaxID=435880 RepID=A0A1I2QLK7_9BACT|nr:hypothetical protein [Algoriphagus hitonicola]SFG28860.1 hypothetical protein SAMN04487988_102329 [Algoriphagus hitonicola]